MFFFSSWIHILNDQPVTVSRMTLSSFISTLTRQIDHVGEDGNDDYIRTILLIFLIMATVEKVFVENARTAYLPTDGRPFR